MISQKFLNVIAFYSTFPQCVSKTVTFTKFLPKNSWKRIPEISTKNFREINSLVSSLVKTLIWRKKCWFFLKNRDRMMQNDFTKYSQSQNEQIFVTIFFTYWFHGKFMSFLSCLHYPNNNIEHWFHENFLT